MKERLNYLKRAFLWLLRDELPLETRLVNVSSFAITVCVFVALIVTILNKGTLLSVFPIVISLAFVITGFWLSAYKNKPTAATYLEVGALNLIVFPLMYFLDGGRKSGMIVWILFGLLFDFMMMQGKACAIMVLLNAVSIAAVMYVEAKFPQMVVPMADETSEMIDQLSSLFLVGAIFGCIFKAEINSYQRQQKSLLEKDAKMREMVEELERTSKAKTDFLANMSHEIRTPINSILGMNEMILREGTDANINGYASNIQTSGNALLALVNDILDFSKVEAGKLELVPVEYEMYSLLYDSYHIIKERAKAKNLEIRFHNNPNIPAVLCGDEIRLRQIINNLLSNAVKYTKEGSIDLFADYSWMDETTIQLSIKVEDTGDGIRKEDLPRLFESFERIDEKKNRTIEGTGLGLPITKQLVELMEGTIEVKSEYQKGSTFIVNIPQHVISPNPMGDIAPRLSEIKHVDVDYHEPFHAPHARVLSVDDVQMNHDVVCMLLKRIGVEVDVALSGAEALDLIRKNTYHMVFMDHMMPGMDGIETFRAIREMNGNPNQEVPCVIVTANAVAGAKEQYLRQGFNGYISKPVKGADLENALYKYLPKRLIELVGEGEKETKTVSVEDKKPIKENGKMETTLSRFSFLDTKAAMEYCANMPDLLIQALHGYVGNDNRLMTMKQFYEEKNWPEYRVVVHAIKSSSLIIGAPELSEHAKALEFAVRDDKIDYVLENHAKTYEEYESVIEKIKEAFADMGE